MFTEIELEVINRLRYDYTKTAYKQLKAIREKYDENEKKNKNCGCSMAVRKRWINDFNEWYEVQK